MVNTFFSRDTNGHIHLWLRKSSAASDAKLAYFKRKVLEALKASAEREKQEIRKALIDMEADYSYVEKAGYPVGTIREWKGRKFIKIAQGKWRPKYDSETRGAKLAVRAIMRKVNACTSSEQLLQIVLANKARFTDAVGGPLDIVRELSDYVNKKNDELEGKVREKAKAKGKQTKAEHAQEKPHIDSRVLELCKKYPDEYKNGQRQAKDLVKGESDEQIKREIKRSEANVHGGIYFLYEGIDWDHMERDTMSDSQIIDTEKVTAFAQGKLDYMQNYLVKKAKPKAYAENAVPNGRVAKMRQELREKLRPQFGLHKNEKTGIEANLSGKSVDKIASDKAIEKSKSNGFTVDEHFEVAEHITELYEKADLTETRPDKNESVNLLSIKRFDAQHTLKSGENADAHITVKESKDKGHKIYSVEVMTLKKVPATRAGVGPSDETHRSSNVSIPPSSKKSSGIDALREKYSASPSVTGDEDEIYLAGNGGTVQGKWKLVEADAPSASHDEQTFNKTEGFPTADNGGTVNDRDYEHDRAAKENVMTVAADYDGRAVGMDEPVVVTEDGVVISGNNRTMSSKLAARNGTDKKYIDALTKKAKRFGFSTDDVGKFKHPRVVFEVAAPDKYTTELFAQFNKSDKKAMSPVEAAVKVCKTMKSETVENIAGKIAEFDTLGEMYADSKTMTGIFDSLIAGGTITKTDLPMYFADGGVTGAGKEFLETVLIGSVINENNIRQMGSEGGKAIRQKLVRAILPLVENKSMDGYSINNEMNNAVQIALAVAKDRKTFKTIDNFLDQSDMFESKPDPVTVAFAKKLDGGTQKEFAQFMLDMNCGLRTAADGQADIFAVGVESKDTIINRVLGIKKAVTNWLAGLVT